MMYLALLDIAERYPQFRIILFDTRSRAFYNYFSLFLHFL